VAGRLDKVNDRGAAAAEFAETTAGGKNEAQFPSGEPPALTKLTIINSVEYASGHSIFLLLLLLLAQFALLCKRKVSENDVAFEISVGRLTDEPSED